jgi:hypothetical protein
MMAAPKRKSTRAPAKSGGKLPRVSKGARPEFYDDPAIDQVFAIVTALTAEISVLFDRLDTLERVLVAAHRLAPGAVESYIADPETAETRVRKREALLRRVFAVLEAYAERQRMTAERQRTPA